MIHVDPDKYLSTVRPDFHRWLKRAAAATIALRKAQPGEVRLDMKIWNTYKPFARAIFHGKCAYCESNVDISGQGDIEMFRPKTYYPWLAYEWRNLLYSCAICNRRYKKDLFPVAAPKDLSELRLEKIEGFGDRKEIWEKPLLLHPYFDRPQAHLLFTEDEKTQSVQVTGLTVRGRKTIDVLGLNRAELVRWRFEEWIRMRTLLSTLISGQLTRAVADKVFREAETFLDDAAVYAGSLRQLCFNWLKYTNFSWTTSDYRESLLARLQPITSSVSSAEQNKAVQEHEAEREEIRSYSVEEELPDSEEKFNSAAKRIERIEAKNLRAVPHLDLMLPAWPERESWLMLIGENGVGKSTILQGVALALMGQSRANQYGIDASRFVRRNQQEGFVKVYINSVGPVTLSFKKDSKVFSVDPPDPKVPLLAYGPTRLLPRDTKDSPLKDKNIRTDNLFKPTVPLSDANAWLKTAWEEDRDYFNNVGKALCRLMLISEKTLPRMNDGQVEIKMRDGWLPISDLSAGYRAMLALVIDIAIGTSGKRSKVEEAVGIVLLDEIESHLHPRWKISIVERLRNVFPQLSFLVTTHDPLCLKGLFDREIVALRRGRTGLVSFATDIPSVDVLKTDDILTSKELFELPSSRNRTSAVTIARYSALLNKTARTKHEESELKRLSKSIAEMLAGSLTPMQREIERVIKNVMKALREGKNDAELTRDVLAEIRRQMRQIEEQR
jgi:uncharacterized protein (TIGR02646 family)